MWRWTAGPNPVVDVQNWKYNESFSHTFVVVTSPPGTLVYVNCYIMFSFNAISNLMGENDYRNFFIVFDFLLLVFMCKTQWFVTPGSSRWSQRPLIACFWRSVLAEILHLVTTCKLTQTEQCQRSKCNQFRSKMLRFGLEDIHYNSTTGAFTNNNTCIW